jgi:hypothetical protein
MRESRCGEGGFEVEDGRMKERCCERKCQCGYRMAQVASKHVLGAFDMNYSLQTFHDLLFPFTALFILL